MTTGTTKIKDITDQQLLERFCQGDQEAFREIVGRYKNSLYSFLKQFLNQHELVEDVFQETFLQLYASRTSFDPSKPLRPWLFTIAANKAKDALRKTQRATTVSIGSLVGSDEISFEDMLNSLRCQTEQPIEQLERQEMAVKVNQVISRMPEPLREILILAYFNKFSYKQMADILSIPIGTVKSRLHSAVARFSKDWNALTSKQAGQ